VSSVQIASGSSERILPGFGGEVASMPSNVMDMKMVQCGCGFMIQSPNENEVLTMTQMHVKETHHQDTSAREVKGMMKPGMMME
jgi:predicted small metal-binding protein